MSNLCHGKASRTPRCQCAVNSFVKFRIVIAFLFVFFAVVVVVVVVNVRLFSVL